MVEKGLKGMQYSRDNIKNRVRFLKERLSEFRPTSIKKRILDKEGRYDTEEGRTLIDNVLKLKSTDLHITDLLEQVAKDLKVI